MQFELTLLGTGAAVPTTKRFPSAHQLSVRGLHFLLDCGEGAQAQLQRYGRNAGSISHVFITHLHGDHCFGLPGLISSYQLQGRSAPLWVFSPPGLPAMIRAVLRASHTQVRFPLHFQELRADRHELIWSNAFLEVFALPLVHRVPACGYLFREKPHGRTLRPGVVERYGIPFQRIPAIKAGEDFSDRTGARVANEELTLPPPPSRAFAYCTDTAYHPGLIPRLRGIDLLYHDATFCEDARERAAETGHSTAAQAARLAREAGVGRLVLGHFSSRYPSGMVFEEEARRYFPATVAGEDGMRIDLPYAGRAEDQGRAEPSA